LLLKLLGVGVLLGISMISVTAMFGREILLLIYGDPTYAQESLFVAVTVATTISFLASFLGYSMTAARYFRAQMPLFMAVTGSMALACFWLVPSYGLFGAAVALLIAALVQFGLSMAVIVYVLRRNVNTGKETTP
jgi:O-antigen/teichoic acid export membrane protein